MLPWLDYLITGVITQALELGVRFHLSLHFSCLFNSSLDTNRRILFRL